MKRVILMLILVSFLSSFVKENPKVLLYIEDNSMALGYMLTHEVVKMREILKQAGFEVIIATISGETLKADSITVIPDIKLSKVNIDDYSGFIMPCMAPADTMVTPEEKSFVINVVREGKPIAAQTGAVFILAKAGVLNGKKYSFPNNNMASPDMYPEFKSGIYSGNSVVQDGNIITCGVCPMEAKLTGAQDGTEGLTQKLILAMNAKTK